MDNKLSVLSFEEGITKIGLGKLGLKVEDFRTDGTSNYLANLNYHGQTWAAVLRLPAMRASLNDFLDEKRRALVSVDYLTKVLEGGIEVGFDCVLKFGGSSCFVEGYSTQGFLRAQSGVKPLLLIDQIHGRQKRIDGFRYPEALPDDAKQYIAEYCGPLYLSRGAPAWETLEEYPELEEPVAHALAALHLATGVGKPVPFDDAIGVLSEIEKEILVSVQRWVPEKESKEALALTKSLKKWSAGDDPARTPLIRCERFLRTAAGRNLYDKVFERAIGQHRLPEVPLRAFRHGDCHGGNFVLVRYEFALDQPETLLDRVFLNEVFDKKPDLFEVAILIDERNGRITYTLPSTKGSESIRAHRDRHHEIHIIDLDNGGGTTEETKVLHLYDALSYSISMANLTRLFGSPLDSTQVLLHYYDGLRRRA